LETLVLAEEENLSTGRNILGESKQQFCPYNLPIGKMKAERFSLYVVRLHVTKIKKKTVTQRLQSLVISFPPFPNTTILAVTSSNEKEKLII